jgi:VWFA-related protein
MKKDRAKKPRICKREGQKMKKNITQFFVGIMFLVCSFYGISGQKAEQEKRMKTVDVTVTKDGQFLENLTERDFKLYEDGEKVKIDSIEMIEAKKRLAVIFHDPQFWSRKIMAEKDGITDELVQLAQKGYELMIFQLNWITGLERIQPYTSQEESIRKASDQAMMSIGIDKSLEDLSSRSLAADITEQATVSRSIEERGELQAYLNINRRRFEKAMGGILAACNVLRTEAERTSILFISSGIPDLSSSSQTRVLDGVTDAKSVLDAIHSRDQENIGTVRIFDPFNLLEDKKFNQAEQVLEELVHFANSQNVSIYSLDPEVFSRSVSTRSSEYFRPEDTRAERILEEESVKQKQNLRLLSEETNAAFFRGANKFKELHQEMGTVAGLSYRLSFMPRRKKPDGKSHDIKVEIEGGGADIQYKKKYIDYTIDEIGKISLVSAYYNPEFFKDLPFEADFVPFMTMDGEYAPWISLALPTRDLFTDRVMQIPRKTYHLYFWIAEIEGQEKGFKGQINISLDMNQNFRDYINRKAYLWFFFRGKELPFSPNEYQAVYAFVDQETQEFGARQVFFSIPEFKKNMSGAFINCVLGSVFEDPEIKEESFTINPKTGHLESRGIKFMPRVTNLFSVREGGFVFLQVFAPQGEEMIKPEFLVFREVEEESQSINIPGELVVGSYNQKSKAWSGIYKLDLFDVRAGRNIFQARIPVTDGDPIVSQKIKLIKLQDQIP